MGVDFELIKSAFLIELEDILEPEKEAGGAHKAEAGGAHKAEEAHLHTLINKFNKQVAPYQKELISMFLPEVAVEKTKNVGIVTGRPSYHGAGAAKQGARTRHPA